MGKSKGTRDGAGSGKRGRGLAHKSAPAFVSSQPAKPHGARHPMIPTATTEQAYLKDIHKFPRLTIAEERDLTARIREGNEEARQRMIEDNLCLVVSIAHQYADCGVSVMDLIQEGNKGLMKAVVRYELGHGTKFSTYAGLWIKHEIRNYLSSNSRPVRLPAYVGERIHKLRTLSDEMFARLGRPPSVAELAEKSGLPVGRVEKYLSLAVAPIRLDQPIEGEDGDGMETLGIVDESADAPFDRLDYLQHTRLMMEMVEYLDPRDSKVLTMRFGLDGKEPLTCREIGLQLKITKQRVQQIEAKSIEMLRLWMERRLNNHWEPAKIGRAGVRGLGKSCGNQPLRTNPRNRLLNPSVTALR